LRPGTTDFKVLEEVFVQQVYARFTRLLPMGGTILDLGANIGLSAVYLCRASPESRVIAVEPEAGNFRMLVENLRNAGIGCRARAVEAFAGGERGFAAVQDSGNGAWGFRRGPAADAGVPVIPISDLVDGAGPVSLKCDIEGGERELFAHFAEWEHLVSLILLELHTEFLSPDELYQILEGSEFEWTLHGEIPPRACIALIALERKARKPSEISAGLAPLYGESKS
jgi:FkbM family methyltransferase